jgi:fucose permease
LQANPLVGEVGTEKEKATNSNFAAFYHFLAMVFPLFCKAFAYAKEK